MAHPTVRGRTFRYLSRQKSEGVPMWLPLRIDMARGAKGAEIAVALGRECRNKGGYTGGCQEKIRSVRCLRLTKASIVVSPRMRLFA